MNNVVNTLTSTDDELISTELQFNEQKKHTYRTSAYIYCIFVESEIEFSRVRNSIVLPDSRVLIFRNTFT
jgi:hypothetical protein